MTDLVLQRLTVGHLGQRCHGLGMPFACVAVRLPSLGHRSGGGGDGGFKRREIGSLPFNFNDNILSFC